MIDKEKLISLAGAAGLEISVETAEKFDLYAELLAEKNRQVNLTAITDPEGILTKHFLDSVLPLTEISLPRGARVIDVGSGGGFPGIPMKLVRPDLDMVLLDSLNKRVTALGEFCRELGISDTKCIHMRAEDAARGELRESFDAALSRAVARLNVLCELCMPLVKPGGIFAALKGPSAGEEAAEAGRAVSLLGGRLLPVKKVTIPGTELCHTLVVAEKTSPTPEKYPRQSGKISSKPL